MTGKPAPGDGDPTGTFFDDGVASIRARDVELRIHETLEPPPASEKHRIVLYKDRRALSALAARIDAIRPENVVEVGVLDGGSAIYWAERLAVKKLVAFDLVDQAPHLTDYIGRHDLSDAMRIYFGMAQDDGPAIRTALSREFAGGMVDVVVDDASHMHRETRDTLRILLPWVRAGGAYVIEDWAWAHEKDWPEGMWTHAPLMSPLLAELMLICGAGRGVIDRIEIDPNFAIVWRGPAPLPRDGGFNLEDHYVARDYPVVAPLPR